jgi:hypothetical protein
MLTYCAKLPFSPGWCYHPRENDLLSRVVTPSGTKGWKFDCRGIPAKYPFCHWSWDHPWQKGVFSLGWEYNPWQKVEVLYKPRRLPDRNLAVSPRSPPLASLPLSSSPPPLLTTPLPDTPPFSGAPRLPDVMPLPYARASPSPAAGELDCADVRPSPMRFSRMRGPSPTRRPSLTRISSPTRHPRRPLALLLLYDRTSQFVTISA